MTNKLNLSKFWKLSLGLLLLGIGQRLFYTVAVSPWATDRGTPLLVVVISFASLGLGLGFLIPLIIWFYKGYRSDKRLVRLILFYLLSVAIAGFVIGGIGQLLYDYTGFSYQSVRTGVWVMSILIQSVLKLLMCFGLASIYQKLPIRSRKQALWLPLTGVLGVTICLLLFNYWFPSVGTYLVSVGDTLLLIGTLYYFIVRKKENGSEKAP